MTQVQRANWWVQPVAAEPYSQQADRVNSRIRVTSHLTEADTAVEHEKNGITILSLFRQAANPDHKLTHRVTALDSAIERLAAFDRVMANLKDFYPEDGKVLSTEAAYRWSQRVLSLQTEIHQTRKSIDFLIETPVFRCRAEQEFYVAIAECMALRDAARVLRERYACPQGLLTGADPSLAALYEASISALSNLLEESYARRVVLRTELPVGAQDRVLAVGKSGGVAVYCPAEDALMAIEAHGETARLHGTSIAEYDRQLEVIVTDRAKVYPDLEGLVDQGVLSDAALKMSPNIFAAGFVSWAHMEKAEVLMVFCHKGRKHVKTILDPFPKDFNATLATRMLEYVSSVLEARRKSIAFEYPERPELRADITRCAALEQDVDLMLSMARMGLHSMDIQDIRRQLQQMRADGESCGLLFEVAGLITGESPEMSRHILGDEASQRPEYISREQADVLARAAREAGLDCFQEAHVLRAVGHDPKEFSVDARTAEGRTALEVARIICDEERLVKATGTTPS